MRVISLVAGVALVVLLTGFIIYWIKLSSQLAVFDSEKLRGQLIYQLAERKATDNQVKVATRKFNTSLYLLLADYANRHRVVILERRAVVAGGRDITEAIASELSVVMRKQA